MRERTVDGIVFAFSECITCGVLYCVPKNLWDEQQKLGGFHSCSNGHSQGWSQSDSTEGKLRRERDLLKQQTARLEDEKREAIARAEKAEAEATAANEKAKRLKKRAAAGTCPCCRRTFSSLAVHMRVQHPEFVEETGAKVVPIKKGAVA